MPNSTYLVLGRTKEIVVYLLQASPGSQTDPFQVPGGFRCSLVINELVSLSNHTEAETAMDQTLWF